MTDELRTLSADIQASIVLNGDLSRLTPAQKVEFYNFRCYQAGLDPSAKPFDLLKLNGKEILYANAGCSQQLTSIHKLSHQITARELVEGIYCVFCRVTGPDNRSTENMGAVPVDKLTGEAKANAYLKATTKAIRRSVLAHMGLGMMDETEVETIPGAKTEPLPTLAGELLPAKADEKPEVESVHMAPASDPWTLEYCEAYTDLVQTQLYAIFNEAGHPEACPAEAEKWVTRRVNEQPPVVIQGLKDRIKTLKDAIAKKAKAIVWKSEDDERFSGIVEQISEHYRTLKQFDDLETFRQNALDAKAVTAPGKLLLALSDELSKKLKEIKEQK